MTIFMPSKLHQVSRLNGAQKVAILSAIACGNRAVICMGFVLALKQATVY
ncbi:MAG: hypothetical protein ACTS3T_03040 [Almyronema sp.]